MKFKYMLGLFLTLGLIAAVPSSARTHCKKKCTDNGAYFNPYQSTPEKPHGHHKPHHKHRGSKLH